MGLTKYARTKFKGNYAHINDYVLVFCPFINPIDKNVYGNI